MESRPRTSPPRTITLAATLALVLAMLATTVGIADAQGDEPQVNDGPTDVRPALHVETLRLACAPDFINGERGVLCKWSEATNPKTRAYQLYRIVDGSARELLTTVGNDGRRAYFDTDVSAPSSLVYGVVSLNRQGRLIGRSAPVYVQFGQDIEELRMSCRPASIEGERGVRCRWSETTQPGARGYLVYRSVGHDARELIAEIPVGARRVHFDRDISPGEVHTYAVLAVDGDGQTVARGGPKRVHWPVAD